ncbi:hypothetical protein DPMN_167871 [Dreissena polymorpha]|uniref:Uncharacterized protein n=1 Tax=Dreissena polymorpha TaxID=45954 RepID=A0A9D4EZM1_DREPO|nr:hypothetical protein DPMN_167871 [Dreissena polymorpha]
MHVLKVSSQNSLCSPHRLIRGDSFRFRDIFLLKEVPFNDNPVYAENVAHDMPVKTAQAMGRQFTSMHNAQFSQTET